MRAVVFCGGILLGGLADVEDLGRRYDLSWTCDPATGRHTIEADCLKIVLSPGIDVAIVNGAPERLSVPPVLLEGRLHLSPELVRRIEIEAAIRGPALPPPAPPPSPPAPPRPRRILQAFRIVIDPGHGGVHTGYIGPGGLMEKDINLGVSLELAKILREMGADVVLTRTTDRHFHPRVDEDLEERVRIVNSLNPDLFLSIHTNGVSNPSPRGFEIWVPKHARGARDRESREIARLLRAELVDVWGPQDRGTKDEKNLRVLGGTTCPAALVEMEFVSNPWVERQLARPEVRARLAASIAEAVGKWAARR